MNKDPKVQQSEEISKNEQELLDRRGFLLGLKKWSKIVIGGALVGGALLDPGREREAVAWVNRVVVARPGPITPAAGVRWSDPAAARPGPIGPAAEVLPGPIAGAPGPIAEPVG